MRSRVWFLVLTGFLITFLISSTTDHTRYGLSDSTYSAPASGDGSFAPSISFTMRDIYMQHVSRFTFSFDPQLSAPVTGDFSIRDGWVIAVTDDGERTYTFSIRDNETLVFLQEQSSPVTAAQGKIAFPDRTEFIREKE